MPETIAVELARLVDRDLLLGAFGQRGLRPAVVEDGDRIVLELPCGDDTEQACADVMHEVEAILAELAVPLVPLRVGDRIFVGPPGD